MFFGEKLEELKHRAIEVLKLNHYKNFTKPSHKFYPHQWNWDSAFIAIGLSHIDEVRAQLEIISLLEGQWSNGMIPHIIYTDSSKDYLPKAKFWGSKQIDGSPKNKLTSGITQPPILSFAALKVYDNSKDKNAVREFLREILPKLISCQRFLNKDRDFIGDGLISIIHPWETGLDNSPRWDHILQKIVVNSSKKINRTDNKLIAKHQRPTDKDYQFYFFIAEKLREQDYKIRDYSKLPFVIQDVMFNALTLLSLESLIKICELIEEESSALNSWYNNLSNAINTKLWNKENNQFLDWDINSNEPINNFTLANCIPLVISSLAKEQKESIVNYLTKQNKFWNKSSYPLSTIPLTSIEFNPQNYWRGPVWINLNWLIIQGLKKHGFNDLAKELSTETIRLVSKSGFYEYFNPLTGEGCGSDFFSWTAALVIDLIFDLQSNR